MQKPQRIQRKRTKGYDMQAESVALNGLPAVSVCRPGVWGNPHKVGYCEMCGITHTAKEAELWFDMDLRNMGDWALVAVKSDLRGKNLACFCKIGDPCHGDVLLKLANQ